MASGQELQAQEKREVQKKDEQTIPARLYIPTTDIHETEHALTVVVEMPGVDKSNLDINIENDVLNITGRIDFANYEKMRPVYTEYNIGNYRRSFNLPSRTEREKITADMKDGVLTLPLPKAEQAKPRRISVT